MVTSWAKTFVVAPNFMAMTKKTIEEILAALPRNQWIGVERLLELYLARGWISLRDASLWRKALAEGKAPNRHVSS